MNKSLLYIIAVISAAIYFLKSSANEIFLLIKPMLVPLVNALNDQAFVFIASFLLFISAIVVSILFHFQRVKPAILKQKQIQRGLKALPHAELAKDKTANDAIFGMLNLFQKEGQYISALEQWNDDKEARGRFPSTPFRDYADKSREERGFSLTGNYEAMPSYFTTIGLILTFVGLVAALYFAAAGFRTGNFEEAKAAIIQLLNASAFKFLTSVAALIGSFVISLTLRYGQNAIEKEREVTLSMIESYLSLWKNKGNIVQNSSLIAALNRLNDLLTAKEKA